MSQRDQTPLDAALEGQSDRFKQKVFDVVRRSGINPKDPLFLVLSSLGKFEVLMEEMPSKLDTVVEGWTTEIDEKLDKASSVAIVQQKSAIAKAAETLINKMQHSCDSPSPQRLGTTSSPKYLSLFTSIAPASLLLSGMFTVGIFVGNIFHVWREGGLTEATRLTQQEKEALNWATSADGEYAQQLMKWNALDLEVCRKQTQKLKGRCVMWVVPYNQRLNYQQQLGDK